MKPTYEELKENFRKVNLELANARTKLEATEAKLETAEAKLETAEAKLETTATKLYETQHVLKLALERISALEERLDKNSKNSSKPPSSDQKANSSKKEKKKRKHRNQGFCRKIFPPDEVDNVIVCSLEVCPLCGSAGLTDLAEPLILQQVDLPEVKPTVTQFNCSKYCCDNCSKSSFAGLPEGVVNSAFGPRLMALLASLTGVFHLSKREAIQLVKDLYGVDVSEGSVINIEERVSHALKETYERIHAHVMQSVFTKHFDETSWRNCGKNHYVWVASTFDASCLKISLRRSREAFSNFVKGLNHAPVVTDRYIVYEHLDNPHQYCLAHLIREFNKYAARDGPDGKIGKALESELREICKNHRDFRNGVISKRSCSARLRHQKNRLENHMFDGFAFGSEDLSKLCWRLLNDFSKLWVFSKFEGTEPTNNLAERDLRRIVLWRKKSYGTRSERGQRFVERISSVTQTLKRSGKNVFSYIQSAIKALYEGKEAPFINPTLGF